jgi:hypothetical protein
MITSWDETDGDYLSGRLWRKFFQDGILVYKNRALGVGFEDDFLNFGNTSLYDGYIKLATGSGTTVAQIPSVAGAFGIVRLLLDGDAANDEAVLQYGGGLDVGPFKLANKDLCFEGRVRVDAITASKWSWFLGLATGGAAGAAIADLLFTDSGGALYATNSFVGFQKLYAEGGAVDGMYQKTGQTKVDGAVKTGLDTLHTMVADEWVKLGFRYFAHPKMLCFYVNGVEVEAARLLAADLDAAAFPDDVFLTPTIGAKDVAGDAELHLDMDWWACAQMI